MQVLATKKVLKWVLVLGVLVTLVIVYKNHSPYEHSIFPKCPFRTITGYQCAGCGSQRAVHFLLNGNVGGAFRENPLLVLSIPYLLTGFIFDNVKRSGRRFLWWREKLFGFNAIMVVLAVVIIFWVGRNTPYYEQLF